MPGKELRLIQLRGRQKVHQRQEYMGESIVPHGSEEEVIVWFEPLSHITLPCASFFMNLNTEYDAKKRHKVNIKNSIMKFFMDSLGVNLLFS